jgi:UDP-N-acetylmuramyl pentapeptide phosphotransferase/UDP-N-acetylglucosamine-1-phosphate transferase
MLLTVTFLVSLLISYIIVRYVGVVFNPNDLNGVQKFHEHSVARIGGIAVFLAVTFGLWLLQDQSDMLLKIWLASLPVFVVGFYEDLSARASPFIRLISAFTSISIVFLLLDVGIFSLGFEWIDHALSNYVIVSLLFTLLVMGGAINSLNIID